MFGMTRSIESGVKAGIKSGLDASVPAMARMIVDEYLKIAAEELRTKGSLPKELHAALNQWLSSNGWYIARKGSAQGIEAAKPARCDSGSTEGESPTPRSGDAP